MQLISCNKCYCQSLADTIINENMGSFVFPNAENIPIIQKHPINDLLVFFKTLSIPISYFFVIVI